MSKIFDALRKAEQEPHPLELAVEPRLVEKVERPRRDQRIFEREFGALSSAVQSCFQQARTGKIVLVAGCVEREGATYVSGNLGRMLAVGAGAPVLCLDADFHDLGLSRAFQMPAGPGLADVYDNGRPRDLTGMLCPGDVDNLYLLSAGERRISPVAFFDSPEFEALLGSLRRTFRFVVVDCPPLLKYPEGMRLAARVDGVVLVVRYKHLKREVIRKALQMIEALNAPVLGAVLNRRKFAIPDLLYKLIS